MVSYFFPLFFSLVLSATSIGVFLWFQKKYFILPSIRREAGREHKNKISRWGGVIVGMVFLLTVLMEPSLRLTYDVWGLLVGCLGMLFLGACDDRKPLGWKWQLFFQGIIIISVIGFFNVYISDLPNPFGGRILFSGETGIFFGMGVTLVWFLLVINALNWSDGVDGVAPGTVVLVGLALFAISMRPEVFQPPVAILSLALVGAYFGLFIFNMHPAKIFSGTTGVFVGGFAVAYLSIFAGMKIATAFLVLGIPILDAVRVLWQRFQSGEALTHPDKRHIHHRLLSLGWNEKIVSVFLLGVIFLITLLTFLLGTVGKIITLCFLITGFFLFIWKKK